MTKKANKLEITDAEIDVQLERAWEMEDELEKVQPRGKRAWFDPEQQEVWIELQTGVKTSFPLRLLEGLQNATPEQLMAVTLSPSGFGLHWDALDVHLAIPPLMAQVFGTKQWMAELGRAGGSIKSDKKAKAARVNGKKGGRPRKSITT